MKTRAGTAGKRARDGGWMVREETPTESLGTSMNPTASLLHVRVRVCERYQENTVRLLNRNNKQTVELVNKH